MFVSSICHLCTVTPINESCFVSVLQVSDTGQYVCKATNVAGQVEKNFHLNVYGNIFLIFICLFISQDLLVVFHNCAIYVSFFISSVPPSIDGPAEESVVETISNPVTFACDAIGIPPPSITWLKNGRPIGITAYFRFERCTAEVFHNHANHEKLFYLKYSSWRDDSLFVCLCYYQQTLYLSFFF